MRHYIYVPAEKMKNVPIVLSLNDYRYSIKLMNVLGGHSKVNPLQAVLPDRSYFILYHIFLLQIRLFRFEFWIRERFHLEYCLFFHFASYSMTYIFVIIGLLNRSNMVRRADLFKSSLSGTARPATIASAIAERDCCGEESNTISSEKKYLFCCHPDA